MVLIMVAFALCHAAEPSGMIQITWIYEKGKQMMTLVSNVAF